MKHIILSCLTLLTVIVLAQDKANVPMLTFKEAVKIGLENNIKLTQEKNQLSYTQINKTSSMLQMGPSVQADGQAYRINGNSFNQNEGRVVNGTIDYIEGSVSANMPLFTGLRQVNTFRAATHQNNAQLQRVARTNQDVIRDVANQYLICLLDYQLMKIDEQNVATQRLQYEQIKTQVELGAKAEADLYNQDYQLKNAELMLIRSRNKLKNDKAALAVTIQTDPSLPFEIENVDWDVNALVSDSLTLEEMYTVGLERRADLKEAASNEQAAHFNYSALKGNYFPSLYAGASYGSRYNYIYDMADNRSFDEQFRNDNRRLSYGLSLVIPIYSGLQTRTNAAFRKVTYQNASIQKEGVEVKVKSDILLAYQNFTDAQTNYQATNAQLKAAELTYKTEKERYDLGISNIVQLTTANQSYIKAQADYQNALFTLMFQKLLTSYATGTLRFEDIP